MASILFIEKVGVMMFLKELRLWNFRKYISADINGEPGLVVSFKEGLNVLVGENDSGKTSIVDAIKLTLGTKSHDYVRVDIQDFSVADDGSRANELKIECVFKGLDDIQSGMFLEFINFDQDGQVELRVQLNAKEKNGRVVSSITAGVGDLGVRFDAADLLRATYLKPLRDAENELTPGYRSRLAQVLGKHQLFEKKEKSHVLERYFKVANHRVKSFFEKDNLDEDEVFDIEQNEPGAKAITGFIDKTLQSFMGTSFDENNYKSFVDVSRNELSSILRKLSLNVDENKVGLGTLNQLFIALELLLFEIEKSYNIALIEEIEAHLHPQAQLRLIKSLQESSNANAQYIITTHSITLASVIKLENIILCKDKTAYPMGSEYTLLSSGDYKFLERFLDATKANLFFAKGVIFVEGDSENLLVPILADLLDKPLHKYGVSVVNIGNTAFLRYSNIYNRSDGKFFDIPVSIVTDLDVKPQVGNPEQEYIVYRLPNDKRTEIASEFSVTLESFVDTYFSSKDRAITAVKKENNIDNFTKHHGLKKRIEDSLEEVNDFDLYKKTIRENKLRKYCTDTVEVYLNNWTLEYDIALSGLRAYMLCAIRVSKMIKNNEDLITEIDLTYELDEAKKAVADWEAAGESEDKIAYLIYEDLLEKRASKAVAAQYLGELLLTSSEQVKSIIGSDEKLKFLVDAIDNVCRNVGGADE